MARLLKWGTKFGIVGYTVYYTKESQIWSDRGNTEQLYKDIYCAIYPLIEDVPVEIPELPKAGDISRAIVDGWNAGVFHSASFLGNLPSHAYNGSMKAYEWVAQQNNQPTESS